VIFCTKIVQAVEETSNENAHHEKEKQKVTPSSRKKPCSVATSRDVPVIGTTCHHNEENVWAHDIAVSLSLSLPSERKKPWRSTVASPLGFLS